MKMMLPYGASEKELSNCISILRDITGKQEVNELALEVLNIVYVKGGDYSAETIYAFAEVYLKISEGINGGRDEN